jgi:hypothetical protein
MTWCPLIEKVAAARALHSDFAARAGDPYWQPPATKHEWSGMGDNSDQSRVIIHTRDSVAIAL